MTKRVSLEEVKRRIRDIHGDTITMIDESYTFVTSPAKFIDKDFGEFDSNPKYVFDGHCCRNRANVNRRATNMKLYGCEVSSQNDNVKQKGKKTCLERFGVDNVFKLHDVHERGIQASISEKSRNKAKQTCIKRYGAENPFASSSIKLKCRETLMKNHGVESPMHSPEIKSKYDWKLAKTREHQTRKLNGSYERSKIEDTFFTILVEEFQNIDRQVIMNGWAIDFYIKDIDMYVQFDGIYWHGLDRPIEEIRLFKNPRDVLIEGTFKRDLQQNAWFKTNNKQLVRITDKEFKEWQKEKKSQNSLQTLKDLILAKSSLNH